MVRLKSIITCLVRCVAATKIAQQVYTAHFRNDRYNVGCSTYDTHTSRIWSENSTAHDSIRSYELVTSPCHLAFMRGVT